MNATLYNSSHVRNKVICKLGRFINISATFRVMYDVFYRPTRPVYHKMWYLVRGRWNCAPWRNNDRPARFFRHPRSTSSAAPRSYSVLQHNEHHNGSLPADATHILRRDCSATCVHANLAAASRRALCPHEKCMRRDSAEIKQRPAARITRENFTPLIRFP